jgi:hypothetical protein
MPNPRRKTKVPLNPNKPKEVNQIPLAVQKIAATYAIDLTALLDWKLYPNGKVVLIAANGMKFVYEAADDDKAQDKPLTADNSKNEHQPAEMQNER